MDKHTELEGRYAKMNGWVPVKHPLGQYIPTKFRKGKFVAFAWGERWVVSRIVLANKSANPLNFGLRVFESYQPNLSAVVDNYS